jgi:hypothetical protein
MSLTFLMGHLPLKMRIDEPVDDSKLLQVGQSEFTARNIFCKVRWEDRLNFFAAGANSYFFAVALILPKGLIAGSKPGF